MKKSSFIGFSAASVIAASLAIGCASTQVATTPQPAAVQPATTTAPAETKNTIKVPAQAKKSHVEREMIDWKGASIGQPVPDWVVSAADNDYTTLSAMSQFKDKQIFFAESQGKNLDVLKSWVQNFQVQSEFAKSISNYVVSKFGGELSGDKNTEDAQSYLTEVSASFSKQKITGLRKFQDYWILTRYIDNDAGTHEDTYQYFVVYTIDDNVLAQQVDKVLGNIEAKTEKQQELKNETHDLILEAEVLSLIDEQQEKEEKEAKSE